MKLHYSFLIFLITSFQVLKVTGQYSVINPNGAKTYSTPDFENPIGIVSLGEALDINNQLDILDSIQIGRDFYLTGNWMETTVDSQRVYVFSSDLTSKPLNRKVLVDDILIVNTLGQKLKSYRKTDTLRYAKTKTKIGEFTTISEYESGTIKDYDDQGGCTSTTVTFTDHSLAEVYHQTYMFHITISESGDKNTLNTKHYGVHIKRNPYTGKDELVVNVDPEEVIIVIEENGDYVMEFGYCA